MHTRITRKPHSFRQGLVLLLLPLARHKGSCTIITGDATDRFTYSAFTDKADVLLTDPPYCLLHRRRRKGDLRDSKFRVRKIDNDPTVLRFNTIQEYTDFSRRWLKTCSMNLKPHADMIIWTNALGKMPLKSLCHEMGYTCIAEYLWAKRTKPISEDSSRNEILLRVYETALIFRHKSFDTSLQNKALPLAVITDYHEEGAETKHSHPCHKPIASLEPLILGWTKKGDLILDPFIGSGGIAKACVLNDRSVMGIEILKTWSDFAKLEVGIS
jgi:site-specific DNA-methyltransferase (adenine-specific)